LSRYREENCQNVANDVLVRVIFTCFAF